MGRLVTWTPDLRSAAEERIIEGLSQGISLADLCREEGMPGRTVVYEWRDEDSQGFGERFARARNAGYDVIASDLRETARGRGESTKDVLRDKLIIDTDLKLLAKWNPKKYGDRTIVAGDPDAPLGATQDPISVILAMIKVGIERAKLEDLNGGDLA